MDLRGILARTNPRRQQVEEAPRRIRRQFLRELRGLEMDEQRISELLRLRVNPRLSLVDEERALMLLPGDRDRLKLTESRERQREEQDGDRR